MYCVGYDILIPFLKSSKIAVRENLPLQSLVLYGMQLMISICNYHGNILAELLLVFCAGLERVDGTTVLGKLDLTMEVYWRENN